VPMFVRAGAIIPMGPEMNYVGEKPADPINFAIYPDENGSASTTLYEDEGVSRQYEQGVVRRQAVSISQAGKGFQISLGKPEGSLKVAPRKFGFFVEALFRVGVVRLHHRVENSNRD